MQCQYYVSTANASIGDGMVTDNNVYPPEDIDIARGEFKVGRREQCTWTFRKLSGANKGGKTMRVLFFTAAFVCSGVAFGAAVVPNDFSGATPPTAEQLNENFDYIEGAINTVANARTMTTEVSSSDPSVSAASCPLNRYPVSTSCECSNDDGDRNFGVLFACRTVRTRTGGGGIAACFDYLIDFSKPAPLAKVTVLCGNSGAVRSGKLPKSLVADDGNEESSKAATTPYFDPELTAEYERLMHQRNLGQREAAIR